MSDLRHNPKCTMVEREWPAITDYGFDPNVVGPIGTGTNGILLVGEAPGESEAKHGEPFWGMAPAGGMLSRLLKRGGWQGWDYATESWANSPFRLVNTVWQRPPANVLDGAGYEAEAIEHWRPALESVIQQMQPKCIVTLGNTALKALTNYGAEGVGVSNVRGYVLRSYTGHWLVPTFHPSYIVQGGSDDSGVFIFDVTKGSEVAANGWRRRPVDYLTHPSLDAWDAFVHGYNPDRHFLDWDIETPESDKLDEGEMDEHDISYTIIRASFCYQDGRAASIPWRQPYLDGVRQMLASNGPKSAWNGRYFDNPRVIANGYRLNGRQYDPMYAWKFLQPTLRKGLGFVAPFYNWPGEPWKHLNGSQPEFYSATDAHALQHIREGVFTDLRAQGMWDRYESHEVEVANVLQQMSDNGIPYNTEYAKQFEAELQAKHDERLTRLQETVPEELKLCDPKNGYKVLPQLIKDKIASGNLRGCVLRNKDEDGEGKEAWYTLIQREYQIPWEKLTKAQKAEALFLYGTEVPTVMQVRWTKRFDFNPGSSPQKLKLIHLWGYKAGKNRKTKKESADDDALDKIMGKLRNSGTKKALAHLEVFACIRECMQLQKVLGTYIKGWRPGADGQIHATGGFWGKMFRISWRNPNIGATIQDKKEDQIAAGFRKCVQTTGDEWILESDWKGIEAVIVGWFAQDEDYMRLGGLGVHAYMTSLVLAEQRIILQSDVPDLKTWSDPDIMTAFSVLKKKFRGPYDQNKHGVHLSNYGGTPPLMFQMYPESFPTLKAAKRWQDFYFGTVAKKVRQWQQTILQQAYHEAHLTNPYRYNMAFWDVFRWDQRKYEKLRKDGIGEADARKRAYKMGEDAKSALSFMPRDTAAGMLKDAMLRLEMNHRLATRKIMRATIHDSIMCVCKEKELAEVAQIVRMEQERPVPELNGLVIKVDQKVGQQWHDDLMEDYKPTLRQVMPEATLPPPIASYAAEGA